MILYMYIMYKKFKCDQNIINNNINFCATIDPL